MPLQLRVLVKRESSADAGELAQLYPELDAGQAKTFSPAELVPGRDALTRYRVRLA